MSDYTHPQFGTPNQSPFDILSRPRSVEIAPAKHPMKRGPKGKSTLHGISAKSDELIRQNKAVERARTALKANRLGRKERELAITAFRPNTFTIASQAASDRTNSIGRRP